MYLTNAIIAVRNADLDPDYPDYEETVTDTKEYDITCPAPLEPKSKVSITHSYTHEEEAMSMDEPEADVRARAKQKAKIMLNLWFEQNGQAEAQKQSNEICVDPIKEATETVEDNRPFTKNDCDPFFAGTEVQIPHSETATAEDRDLAVAQQKARAKAQAALDAWYTANGQNLANEQGQCKPIDTTKDGVPDFVNCPNIKDSHLSTDKDKDGIPDNREVLANDNASVKDIPGQLDDWFNWDEKHQKATLKVTVSDFDGDTIWDMCDTDSDNDKIPDNYERHAD